MFQQKLIGFGLLLSLYATIHFGFYLWRESRKAKIWQAIPESALAVLEIPKPASVLAMPYSDPTLEALAISPFMSHLMIPKGFVDSLDSQEMNRILASQTLYISFHHSAGKLDALHFLPLGRDYDLEWLDTLVARLIQKSGGSVQVRNYEGYTIRDIASPTHKHLYSYTLHKDCLVGSRNAVLVEDMIRKTDKILAGNYFHVLQKRLKKYPASGNAILYFDAQALAGLLEEIGQGLGIWKRSGKTSIAIGKNQIQFHTTFTTSTKPDLGTLIAQTAPQPMVLPREFAYCFSLLIPDGKKFARQFSKLVWQGSISVLKAEFDREDFLGYLQGTQSFIGFRNGKKLLVFHSDRADHLLKMLAGDEAQDSVLVETQISEFPAKLLGTAFLGFDKSFALRRGRQLLLSNTPKTIADYISLEKKKNGFFSDTLRGFDFKINTLETWQDVLHWPKPEYRLFLERNKKTLTKFLEIKGSFVLQDQTLTSSAQISWKRSTKHLYDTPDSSQRFCAFKNPIQAGPWSVFNHLTDKEELLVLEAESGFFLLNSDGKVISSYPLQGVLPHSFAQIDLYANGRLQYWCVAGGAVRCFDRSGKSLVDFPMRGEKPFIYAQAVDFGDKKNYLVAGITSEGEIYGLSKYGTPLKHWQPIKLGAAAVHKVAGLTFGKKSYIVVLTQDGTARVFDEHGENHPGFPLSFKVAVSGKFAVEAGATPAQTLVRFVTHVGELISFDLQGKVRGRQVLQAFSDAVFELVYDRRGSENWVILAQNTLEMGVFSTQGELLLRRGHIEPGIKELHYHHLGRHTEVLTATDPRTKRSMVFSIDGQPLLPHPVSANPDFAFLYEEASDSYKVVFSYHNKLFFTRFDR